jgi:hypothetical protein
VPPEKRAQVVQLAERLRKSVQAKWHKAHAKPTTLAEAMAADEAWFELHPEYSTRWRETYEFEPEGGLFGWDSATAVHKTSKGIRWYLFCDLRDAEFLIRGEPDAKRAEDSFIKYTGDAGKSHLIEIYDRAEAERKAEAERERVEQEARQREEQRGQAQARQEQEKRQEQAAKVVAEQKAKEEHDRIERAKLEQVERKKRGEPIFDDEAYEQLPGDLRLVSFRLCVEHDDEDASVKAALERCFGSIGTADADGSSVTVELVTTAALVAKYLDRDGALVQGWTIDGARFELVGEIEMASSFTRRRQWVFRGVDAPHKPSYKAGAFSHWLDEKAQAREEDFAKLVRQIDLRNGNVVSIAQLLSRARVRWRLKSISFRD